ncbi:hypothetical protein DH2020_015556 [Rehmannia glutinosa]|uniref:Uncharacterized protein n=1 Tax=Rehmannia glutinosa TaxID=99300 RepID=A0ABR0WU14_REHGL
MSKSDVVTRQSPAYAFRRNFYRANKLVMTLGWRDICADPMHGFLVAVISAVIFGTLGAGSVAVPSTSCYALDNTSHIHDFSNLIGQLFEYDDDKASDITVVMQDPDLVVRFCKDVETRSQPGYVDFGRFDKFNHFIPSSGHANFVQEYYNGDLMKCEKSYDKLGRTAQVNIICGNCPNGQCVGRCGLGCICNVTYESTCRVLIDLAIPCMKPGLRVFEGFTVGFHPRSWEIVYNGMTQLGYEMAYDEFSFRTEQRDVTLYLTAVASLSNLVQKPTIKISPEQGLNVRLSGSGANGRPPTTLSPTMIVVDWRLENYDPVQFTFAKMCGEHEFANILHLLPPHSLFLSLAFLHLFLFSSINCIEHRQDERGEATRGWAIFGILSCVLIVAFTLFCVGGFIYRTRVSNLRGLDALPGMAILSACLETVSRV